MFVSNVLDNYLIDFKAQFEPVEKFCSDDFFFLSGIRKFRMITMIIFFSRDLKNPNVIIVDQFKNTKIQSGYTDDIL